MDALKTLLSPETQANDAALHAALSKLAQTASTASQVDARALSLAAREGGALEIISAAVCHDDARIHQSAIAIILCFTTTEVWQLATHAVLLPGSEQGSWCL